MTFLARWFGRPAPADIPEPLARGERGIASAGVVGSKGSANLVGFERAGFDPEALDERLVLLLGRLAPGQQDEYASYGPLALAAALDLDEGRFVEAEARFAALVAGAEAPVYLLRDLGRARVMLGRRDAAAGLFERFLALVGSDAPAEILLETHVELARDADARGDVDGAITWLSALLDVLPDDPNAYLALGTYMRQRGFVDEALEVYEAASSDGTSPPSSALLEEVGLCQLARGKLPEAEWALAEVVRRARCACGAKVPPLVADALALVYERTGRPAEAETLRRSVGIKPCATHS